MGKGWKREGKGGWVHTSVTICTSAFLCVSAAFCGGVLLSGCAGTGGNSVKALEPKTVSYKADDYDSWNELMQKNQISDSFQEALEQFAFQSASRVLEELIIEQASCTGTSPQNFRATGLSCSAL